ncbi:hypothetical protein L9F63_007869, partial [Diploptera punctata]
YFALSQPPLTSLPNINLHISGFPQFPERRVVRHSKTVIKLTTVEIHNIVTESTKPLHMSLGTFYEEVHGVATNGSNRRIDIIAFGPSSKIVFMVMLKGRCFISETCLHLRNFTMYSTPKRTQSAAIFP